VLRFSLIGFGKLKIMKGQQNLHQGLGFKSVLTRFKATPHQLNAQFPPNKQQLIASEG
jgi:hypothetical protein